MSLDSAKGPSSGYYFQFELALLHLALLKKDEKISIEKVDDIAKENLKSGQILSIQAKHSIVSGQTSFGSTSKDLWKTLTIWADKLSNQTFNKETEFLAVSNKSIPKNSIAWEFQDKSFEECIIAIGNLLKRQQQKLEKAKKNGKTGKSIEYTIKIIQTVISKKDELEIIISNFKIKENINVKNEFLSKVHLDINTSDEKLIEIIYEDFIGWISTKSVQAWKNGNEAQFSKYEFDEKYHTLLQKHSFSFKYFRNRDEHNVEIPHHKEDTYIQQLKDLDRNRETKEDIIKEAILDKIACELEISHIITNTNSFTEHDFLKFEELCEKKWKEVRNKHFIKDLESYSNEELNSIANSIYTEIMYDVKLKFQDTFGFDSNNKYIQNGSFLSLSDYPKIGWHPKWKELYG